MENESGIREVEGDAAADVGFLVPSSVSPIAGPPAGDLGLVLDDATLAKVRRVVADGTPANTKRAYAADLRFFEGWREASGFPEIWPVPPEVIVRFLVEQVEGMAEDVEARLIATGVKRSEGIQAWSTVERRIAAVATAHRTKGLASPLAHPAVVEMVGRARRASVARGWSPKRKAAADRRVLERLLETCEDTLTGIRDRAILLFGFSTGGRRRSEIAGTTVERLQRVGQDYVYRLGRTKTNQDGDDKPVPLVGRAAAALSRWLAMSGIQEGPLFRAVWDNGTVMDEAISSLTVARMIKRRAALAGLDPEVFGGHSLRAGFMTEAGIRGHSLAEAMSLSDHKDVNTAVIYYRAGEVLSIKAGRMMEGEHAAAGEDDDLGVIMEAAAGLAAAAETEAEGEATGAAPPGTPTVEDYFGEPEEVGAGSVEDEAQDREAGAVRIAVEPPRPEPGAPQSDREGDPFRPSFLD